MINSKNSEMEIEKIKQKKSAILYWWTISGRQQQQELGTLFKLVYAN